MSELTGFSEIVKRIKDKNPKIAGYLQEFEQMTERERVQWQVDNYNQREGDLHLKDGYVCDKCRNKGYVSSLRERTTSKGEVIIEELHRTCTCEKIRKSIRRMKRSGLEDLFKKCTFGNYEAQDNWQKVIKQKAESFSNEPKGIFYIGGQSGCGKTHLCTAIARSLIMQENELRYLLWRDESIKLKSAINKEEVYQKMIEELKTIDVLYIDDFLKVPAGQDVSKPTSADLSLALEIINNRYNAQRITIISSEWTIRNIIDFDEALGGRIYELAGEYCMNIGKDTNKNYRIRNMIEL